MMINQKQLGATLLFVLAELTATGASAITAEVAKKCESLTSKAFPPLKLEIQVAQRERRKINEHILASASPPPERWMTAAPGKRSDGASKKRESTERLIGLNQIVRTCVNTTKGGGLWLCRSSSGFKYFLTMIESFEVLSRMPWRRIGPNDVPAVFEGSHPPIFWGRSN
jgi:hypothetical protein